jgi:UDP-3-O-[3-hydroxymyristoyl] glucosamine N-acyltransferase
VLDDTVIGAGTKIDNLVHVAHNAVIGKNCMLVCHCGIGGSVVLGDNVWVGMGAQIRNGFRVGSHAVIGMGAVVTKDVPEGVTVVGNPAKEIVK